MILFLDCDGVVNHITDTGYDPPHPGMRPECVTYVGALVLLRDLKVVISSSWRENYSVRHLKELFAVSCPGGAPIAKRIIDVTPIFERVPKVRNVRGQEVAAWLAANTKFNPLTNVSSEPYVIVDDSKKHGFPADRFVRTDGRIGFTQDDVGRALAILDAQVEVPA